MAYYKSHKLCLYGCLLSMLTLPASDATASSMRNYTKDNTGRPQVEIDLNAVHDIQNSDDVFIDHSSWDENNITAPDVYVNQHNNAHVTADPVASVEREILQSLDVQAEKPASRPFDKEMLQKPVARPANIAAKNVTVITEKPTLKPPQLAKAPTPKQPQSAEQIMAIQGSGPIARPPMAVARIQPSSIPQEDEAPAVQPHPQAQEITPKAVIEAAKDPKIIAATQEKEETPIEIEQTEPAEKAEPIEVATITETTETVENKVAGTERLVAPAIPTIADVPAQSEQKSEGRKLARISFNGADTELTSAQKAILDKHIKIMRNTPNARLMIETYANGKEAQRISILRGFAVRIYLMDNGVGYERMQFTPRGNNTDITPIDRADLYLVQ